MDANFKISNLILVFLFIRRHYLRSVVLTKSKGKSVQLSTWNFKLRCALDITWNILLIKDNYFGRWLPVGLHVNLIFAFYIRTLPTVQIG